MHGILLDIKINYFTHGTGIVTMVEQQDPVDKIKQQWQQECPDLRLDAMEILGRLKRCSVLYQPFLDVKFEQFGLTSWEFDVLATLRRSGDPFTLTPTELFSTLMVTSGTMTHRLKSLENKQLIQRAPNPTDARHKLVQLTEKGLQTVNRALVAHVDNMEAILEPLNEQQKAQLNQSLTQLLQVFETLHKDQKLAKEMLNARMHGL